ncbi:unnamed protein product [Choristocarpus tenellus]
MGETQNRQLGPLICSGNSPDFWTEEHGLTTAVHGGGRGTEYGTHCSSWEWPKHEHQSTPAVESRLLSNESLEPLHQRTIPSQSRSWDPKSDSRWSHSTPTSRFGSGVGQGSLQSFRPYDPCTTVRARRLMELPLPGVVANSDYRLMLPTGVKFTSSHLMTVLDRTRVLVNEVVGTAGRGGRMDDDCLRTGYLLM